MTPSPETNRSISFLAQVTTAFTTLITASRTPFQALVARPLREAHSPPRKLTTLFQASRSQVITALTVLRIKSTSALNPVDGIRQGGHEPGDNGIVCKHNSRAYSIKGSSSGPAQGIPDTDNAGNSAIPGPPYPGNCRVKSRDDSIFYGVKGGDCRSHQGMPERHKKSNS